MERKRRQQNLNSEIIVDVLALIDKDLDSYSGFKLTSHHLQKDKNTKGEIAWL